MDNAAERVVPLDQLDDYKVAEGDPDVRGWDVFAADGRKIGEVDELLVDRTAMKVRYLDVEMDDDLDDGTDKHILIPIGYARLDEAEDQIRVDTLDSSRLGLIPSYTHGPLTREYETDLRTHYAGTSAAGGSLDSDTSIDSDNDLYAGDMYDDRRFYGSRRGIIDRDRRTGADELDV